MLTREQAEAASLGTMDSILTLPQDAFVGLETELTDYLGSDTYAEILRTHGLNRQTVDSMIRNPQRVRAGTGFIVWMRDNSRGPYAQVAVPQGDSVVPLTDVNGDPVYPLPEVLTIDCRMGTIGNSRHNDRVALQQYMNEHRGRLMPQLQAWVGTNPDTRHRDTTVYSHNLRSEVTAYLGGTLVASLLWLPEFAHWLVEHTPAVPQGDTAPHWWDRLPIRIISETPTPGEYNGYGYHASDADIEQMLRVLDDAGDLPLMPLLTIHGETWRHRDNVLNAVERGHREEPRYTAGFLNSYAAAMDEHAVPHPATLSTTTTTTLSEGAPTMTPAIQAFADVYATLDYYANRRDERFLTHEYEVRDRLASIGRAPDERRGPQQRFIELPDEVKATWRDLYNAAARSVHRNNGDEFDRASVADFDRDNVGTNTYGYSTTSFFVWARNNGVTIDDNGSPNVPAEVAQRIGLTTVAVPQGDTLPVFTVGATDEQIRAGLEANPQYLAVIAPVFREYATRQGWGGEWQTYMVGGENRHMWQPRSYYVEHGFQFGTALAAEPYASQIVALLGAQQPVSTTPAAPTIQSLIDSGTLTPAVLRADRVALLTPVETEVLRWWADRTGSATDTQFANFLLGRHTDQQWNRYIDGRNETYMISLIEYLTAHRAELGPATPTEGVTTTDTTPAPAVIPIGPDHPGWQAFAEQMAAVATRNGMCPEYDRIAGAVGLPVRKDRVTTRITIDIPVDVERGHNPDNRVLKEAAIALLNSGYITGQTKSELNRTQTVG